MPLRFIFLLFVALFAARCVDPCTKTSCANSSNCDNGTCYCRQGYEGSNCGAHWADKFKGTYAHLTDDCGKTYTFTIAEDPNDPTLLALTNLGNYPYTLPARFTDNSRTFHIDTQFGGGNYAITAEGSINTTTNDITIAYTCIHSNITEQCRVVVTH